MALSDASIEELLLALDAAPPEETIDRLAAALARTHGASDVALLLGDYDGHHLRRLASGSREPGPDPLPISEGHAGRAFREQAVVVVPASGGGTSVWWPVTLRTERFGVLELRLGGPLEERLRARLPAIGELVAHAVLAGSRYTDLFERVRRHRPLSLAAELQWGLLPVQNYADARACVAGRLVPAYDVGGDNFDYSVDRGAIRLAAVDAMGHGLQASLLCTLAVSALRNRRRSGASLVERATAAHDALYDQFGGERFVVAVLVDLDLASGKASVLNAGQPGVFLVEDGSLAPLARARNLPLGLFERANLTVEHFQLARSSRLMIVSDGLMEAMAPDGGQAFGEQRLAELVGTTSAMSPHDAADCIVSALIEHRSVQLRDDATVLVLDWTGGAGARAEEITDERS